MNRDIIVEMRQVLSAQRAILCKADTAVSRLERELADADVQAEDLRELSSIMAEIEKNAALLELEDFKGWSDDDASISLLYEQTRKSYTEDLETLQFRNWPQFVRDSQVYCLSRNIEYSLPWEAMLTDEDFALIESESYEAQYRWDKWDYILVGSAGVLASIVDIMLVGIPKTMTCGVYKGQQGSVITGRLRSLHLPEPVQSWLEMKAKVPYDHTGGGDHRIDTFGHDPVLGFVFGTIDIVRGGATTIKNGNIAFEDGIADPVRNPLAALAIQVLHMLSDVSTSRGLPVPFASMLRALKTGAFQGPTGHTHTVSEMILWMYHNGYDLRHFVTMGIVPATIEIILRAYLLVRHFSKYGETKFVLADNPKYRCMLLSAHAVACAGNAGKIALMQGNPLAINQAEWMALLRYLVPSLKYWIFDKNRMKLEHMARINEQGWCQLCRSSEGLLKRVYEDTAPFISLGLESA